MSCPWWLCWTADHHDDGHEDYLSLKAYCLRSLKLIYVPIVDEIGHWFLMVVA
ncbi:hypothetical protein MtrunA17_Chr4g0006591 [Medicago truncatula]|uniref:Uncharacterized protein n=1 Tax=Medicago truncatula TaxID=3880 RepID=A0A396I5B2_MEDTR|nr:hypothetical protein MtrunA17_Chr4g0006591 [Medicago truncatula]